MLSGFWQKKDEGGKDLIIVICLIVLGALLYGFKMGSLSLTEPDEVFYAQTAKEMLQRHTWSVPYIFGHPQFEKPILYYFLLAAGFKLFGISAAVARIWSCIFGIFGLVITYFLGKIIFNRRVGVLSAVVLATSFEYLSLSRAVLTDIVFSNLLVASLAAFYFGYVNPKKSTAWLVWSFVAAALAVLTKGPIGIILPLFIFFMFLKGSRELKKFFTDGMALGFLAFLSVALPWYWWIYSKFKVQFIYEFIIRDNIDRFLFIAEHPSNNTWYYYAVTTLGGLLPWGVFLAIAVFAIPWKQLINDKGKGTQFLLTWIAVIFIFFSFAKSKLISYVFPIFPALAILIGYYFDSIFTKKDRQATPGLRVSFVLAVLFLAIVFSAMSVYGLYYNKLNHFLPRYPSLIPFFCLSLPAVIAFIFSWFKKYKSAVTLIASSMVLLIIVGEAWLVKYIDPWVSSRESAEMLKNYLDNKKVTLLCNKMFARGLLYYTGFPIVVVDSSARPFFAAHPITILHDDWQLLAYLKSHPETYCVVKRSVFNTVKDWGPDKFKVSLIYQDKGRYIFKVTPVALPPDR